MSDTPAESNADKIYPVARVFLADEMTTTLPNDRSNHRQVGAEEGSVMWHVPNPSRLGPRSGVSQIVAPEPEQARTVTRDEAASQSRSGGAGLACDGHSIPAQPASKQSTSAKKDVIETGFETEKNGTAAHWLLANSPRMLPGSIIGLAPQERDQALRIVRQARSLMTVEKEARRSRKDTPASDKTLQDYAKKCARIDAEIEHLQEPWGLPIEVVMSRHAPHRQTFNAIKSALKRRALSNVSGLLKTQDALQRTGDPDEAWAHVVRKLWLATVQVDVISGLDRTTLLELTDRQAVRSRSKRQQLKWLKPGWQDLFVTLNASSPTYKSAGVLLRFCGLRPVELEKGVVVTADNGLITVEIQGGKVRAGHAGQPWRRFALNEELLPMWFVEEVKKEGSIGVEVDPDDLRAHLHRLSERLFPRQNKPGKRDVILSAYLLRHALVTELREAGWDTADIAGVIGEATADTMHWYGLRARGGALKPKSVAIVVESLKTATPVRAVDRAKLNALIGKCKASIFNVSVP